ncbi:MAG: SDR family oxidoreductase [Planctomycetes bacterium]|nr:SDR family oxidoreductase [Planctomycetota bacterium]
MTLEGRTALVTGGGTGIGAAVALALAGRGCRVAIAGRREQPLRETASRHTSAENPILVQPVDVADRASIAALFDWARRELGRIDILVNSAGVNVPRRSAAELSPDDWDRMLRINVTGAWDAIRAVLPEMRERRDGLIVNIGSIAGLRCGVIGGVAYNASKHAMTALGKTIANEERDNGIRVTNIYPGEVETPILNDRPQPVSAEHRARILQPEDIAAAVVMIAELPPRACVAELVIKPTTQMYS